MNHSSIQAVMYKLIVDPETNIKLEDFYDDEFIQSIISKYPSYGDMLNEIGVVDIVKVAARLMKEQDLPAKEIWYLVTYICSNYNPSLMDDSDFVLAYLAVNRRINMEISNIDSQIKKAKNQVDQKKDRTLIDRNEQIAKEASAKVAANEEIINGSIKKLKECLKPKIEFNSDKNSSKKYKLQKEQQKIENALVFSELNKLEIMLDNKSKKDDEILIEIRRITENYNLHKSCYHNKIKSIISELNKRKERAKKVYNEIQNNIIDLEIEYNSFTYLTDEEINELRNRKKVLNDASDLLNSLEEKAELTTDGYKKKISSQIKISRNKAKRETELNIQSYEDNSDYFHEDDSLSKKTFVDGCNDYQINKVNCDINSMLSSYQPMSDSKIIDAFCLDNEEYVSGNEMIYKHKYAFSIDYANNNNTIIRMHVINEFPYVSKDAKNFIIDYYFKTELIKERNARGELRLKHELDDDSHYIQKIISNTVSFKKNKIYPTIAYTFTFDKNYHLVNFGIEKCDAVMRDNNIDQLTILDNICDMNNYDSQYYSTKDFFEKILKNCFINYAVNNKMPVIYYGKYIDESHGNIKEGQKLGQQVLTPYDQERIANALRDCEDRVLDNAHFKWFKNYRMKHFSLNYHEDSKYFIKDLGLINPESFMGYNVQRVINKCVFSNITAGIPVYDELVKSQKEYVNKLNKAINFIDIKTFIDSLAEIENNEIRRGSK